MSKEKSELPITPDPAERSEELSVKIGEIDLNAPITDDDYVCAVTMSRLWYGKKRRPKRN